MYVANYCKAMQYTYETSSTSSVESNEDKESPNSPVAGDSVEISPEAKDLAEKNTYENRIRQYFSNTPQSLEEVREEVESLKNQFSDNIQTAMRENGILGSVTFPKFTAFDGTTPPLSRPGLLIHVSKGETETFENANGETVTRVEEIDYASNRNNYHKFNQSIDNDLFGRIAALSTILNYADKNTSFAEQYNQDPAKAVAGAYSELFDKIGYFKPEGGVSSIQYGFVDER
ncbi:MAG: flagellar biosynthesis anti-sigma factor FlgM [Planctomycetaceae bacterium]|nr:flagellar biosynthesis anti-sigma factor FlgM [Planctomycetaceae bacterium]